MNNEKKLRFWCQTVLPLVYDDSLSYYELLNKIVKYLNNTIEDVNNTQEELDDLKQDIDNVLQYIDNLPEFQTIATEVNDYLYPTVTALEPDVENLKWYAVTLDGEIRTSFPNSVFSYVEDTSTQKPARIFSLRLNNDATGYPVGIETGFLLITRDIRNIESQVTIIDQKGDVYVNRYNYNEETWIGWNSQTASLASDLITAENNLTEAIENATVCKSGWIYPGPGAGALWFNGTFTSNTSFRFNVPLSKTIGTDPARLNNCLANIYLYDATSKASSVDFLHATGYSASITAVGNIMRIELINTAGYSVTPGAEGSVYFAEGNFTIAFGNE